MTEHDPYVDADQLEADADTQRTLSELSDSVDDKGFVWLMSGLRGRRFVYRILARSPLLEPSFQGNAMGMANAEGRKSTTYWLISEIQRLCPASYLTMMQENHKNG